jgi:Glycosyl hydrolase family 47
MAPKRPILLIGACWSTSILDRQLFETTKARFRPPRRKTRQRLWGTVVIALCFILFLAGVANGESSTSFRQPRQEEATATTLPPTMAVNEEDTIRNNNNDHSHNNPEKCVGPPPVLHPNLASLSPQRLVRYQAVQGAIQHAWRGYINVIRHEQEQTWHQGYHPPDDIKPLSQKGHHWLYFSATLFDSLDTLYLAQLHYEYKEAVDLASVLAITARSEDLVTTSSHFFRPTDTLEYGRSILGGLLGAYSITGNVLFVQAALRASHALWEGAFASSPKSPLPFRQQVLAPPFFVESASSSNTFFRHFVSLSWWFGVLPRRFLAQFYVWGRDIMTTTTSKNQLEENTLEGIGSLGLEFSFLSAMTWIDKYQQVHETIFTVLSEAAVVGDGGVGFPIFWNVATARPILGRTEWSTTTSSSSNGTIGQGAALFHESLIKVPVFKECIVTSLEAPQLDARHKKDEVSTLQHQKEQSAQSPRCNAVDRSMMQLYHQFVAHELVLHHVHRQDTSMDDKEDKEHTANQQRDPLTNSNAIAYPMDHTVYNHRLCFIPGMLALGVHRKVSIRPTKDLSLAKELLRGCYDTYQRSPTGLGPDVVQFQTGPPRSPNQQPNTRVTQHEEDMNPQSSYFAANRTYSLRPELIESLFVLYRVTSDPMYQDWAWEIFQSLEQHCKTPTGGYAGIWDVYHQKHKDGGAREDSQNNAMDNMPSYFMAKTLKYFLLLFGPDDYMSLDDYVFTTAGHPLWIPKTKKERVVEDLYGRKKDSPVSTSYNHHSRTAFGALRTIPPCGALLYDGAELYDPTVPIPWLVLSLLLMTGGAGALLIIGIVLWIHTLRVRRQRERRLWVRKTI